MKNRGDTPAVEVGDICIVRIDVDLVIPYWPRRVPMCQSSFSTAGILMEGDTDIESPSTTDPETFLD